MEDVTEQASFRGRGGQSKGSRGSRQQNQEPVPGQHVARVAHAAQRHHWFRGIYGRWQAGAFEPETKGVLGGYFAQRNGILLQLINDVLDLAKVEAGKMVLNLESFSLRAAIDQVCAVAKPIAGKKHIQIQVEVAPGLGEVTLDQQKFKQVLYNLLSNAIQIHR